MIISRNLSPNIKIIILAFIVLLESCISGGTHGSIKSYGYGTIKYTLQKVVEKVIAESKNIKRDTVKNYMIDNTSGRNDMINNNYYNDGETYVTININTKEGYSEYTFPYSGDKEYWGTSKNSSISILAAGYGLRPLFIN